MNAPVNKAGYQALLDAVSQACKPRRKLTVSEWADAHRMLSSKGSSEAGPWKTSRTPYLREIMDCLSDRSPVKRIVVIKSAQIGASEAGLNWIGFTMDHSPCPMLVVLPTLEVRKRWVRQRLDPMLSETPALASIFDAKASRQSSNSEDIKDYPGGMLVVGGANSPASLASMPIGRVICDEVDRFPWQVGQEGDPLGLIDERTKTFPRRKVLLISTPTIKDASRIDEEYQRSDQRKYHVPCPHCHESIVLKWQNLRWDTGAKHAWYICEECGCEIQEHFKPAMLANGRWVPANPDSAVRGYHINALYAPLGLGYSWAEMSREWLACHDDPPKLKRFVNTTLGEVWEDRSRDIKPNALMERAEGYKTRTAPPSCLVLTAGVDTQDDRLELQILGWGRNETCWVIDYLVLPGDPSKPEVWMRLAEILNTPICNAYGHDLLIQATAIDTGGHHTHDVYNFVRSKACRRLMAIKGSNTPSKPILAGRPSDQDINWRGKVIKNGVKLWMIGVDTVKHMLLNRLAADAGQPAESRRIRFSQDLPADYYDQLVSEAFDPEKNRWVKRRGRRNEGLDTWVYACAAAHHPEIRVHVMRDRDWDKLTVMLEPTELPAVPVGEAAKPESEVKQVVAQPTQQPAPAIPDRHSDLMDRIRNRGSR
jgi:phage terminase large subunit GpA-like protein